MVHDSFQLEIGEAKKCPFFDRLCTDLWTVPNQWQDENKKIKYCLVVVDIVSRFGFLRGLVTKEAKEVADKMISIINEIRQLQNPMITHDEILFFSDFGQEFVSQYTKDKLKRANAFLFVVGGESKAGLAERLIRKLFINY